MDTLSFDRESKIVHLTLSEYVSIIATESENMTIPPQFGVGQVAVNFLPPYFLQRTFLTYFCAIVSAPQNPSICGLFSVLLQPKTRTSLSPISPFYPQNLHFHPLHLRYMRTLRPKVRMSSNPLFTWVSQDRRFLTLHFLENKDRGSKRNSKRRK